jgi:hypothetical protein
LVYSEPLLDDLGGPDTIEFGFGLALNPADAFGVGGLVFAAKAFRIMCIGSIPSSSRPSAFVPKVN